MKLIIIRHGDPDYEHDSLTETGWHEAELLAQRMAKIPADYYYISCLGRARDTASCTMKKLGREGEVFDWLQEFRGRALKPNHPEGRTIAWDWLPKDWTGEDRYFDTEHWFEPEAMAQFEIKKEYDWVCGNLDALLEQHGYRRKDRYYEVLKPNHDTLVFFCHFGLECVLISHLINVSPMVLWHGFCAAPSSVTTVYTEEREKGIASFRISSFGDVSHLLNAGEEPSFHARFCECFDDDTQH